MRRPTQTMPGDCASLATFVTIDSRSDPTSSRCQISRDRAEPGQGLPQGADNGSGMIFSANERPGWWSQTGSNRRPPACKAGALPTELWPRAGGQRTDDGGQMTSLRRLSSAVCRLIMVGLGRFELPTSRLSSARSNQLSYKPGADDRDQMPEDRYATILSSDI